MSSFLYLLYCTCAMLTRTAWYDHPWMNCLRRKDAAGLFILINGPAACLPPTPQRHWNLLHYPSHSLALMSLLVMQPCHIQTMRYTDIKIPSTGIYTHRHTHTPSPTQTVTQIHTHTHTSNTHLSRTHTHTHTHRDTTCLVLEENITRLHLLQRYILCLLLHRAHFIAGSWRERGVHFCLRSCKGPFALLCLHGVALYIYI